MEPEPKEIFSAPQHYYKVLILWTKRDFAKVATQNFCHLRENSKNLRFPVRKKTFRPNSTQEAEACRGSSAPIRSCCSRRSRSSSWGRGSLSARRGRGSLSARWRGRRRVRQHEGEDGQLQRATASPQACLQQVRAMLYYF